MRVCCKSSDMGSSNYCRQNYHGHDHDNDRPDHHDHHHQQQHHHHQSHNHKHRHDQQHNHNDQHCRNITIIIIITGIVIIIFNNIIMIIAMTISHRNITLLILTLWIFIVHTCVRTCIFICNDIHQKLNGLPLVQE